MPMTWPSECNMTGLAEDLRNMINVKPTPKKSIRSIRNVMQLIGLANGRILFFAPS